jgi:hypothetical protein
VNTPLDGVPGIPKVADGYFAAFVVMVNEEGETKGILFMFDWELEYPIIVSCSQ